MEGIKKMATITLRPIDAYDDAGTLFTHIKFSSITIANRWQVVDEAVADDNTTAMYNDNGSTAGSELWELTDSSITAGIISKVTFYIRHTTIGRGTSTYRARAKPIVGTSLTDAGSYINTTSLDTFNTQAWEVTNNPLTSSAWVWANFVGVNKLYFGYTGQASQTNSSKYLHQITQYYITITYVAPSTGINFNDATCTKINGATLTSLNGT